MLFFCIEVLPLVEFQLEEGITDEEALGLIGSKLLTSNSSVSNNSKSNNNGNSRLRGSASRRNSNNSNQWRNQNSAGNGNSHTRGLASSSSPQSMDYQILQLDDEPYESLDGTGTSSTQGSDPFTSKAITIVDGKITFSPIIIGRETLRTLEPTEVIVCKWPQPMRYTFYKNLLPDAAAGVTQCYGCFKV